MKSSQRAIIEANKRGWHPWPVERRKRNQKFGFTPVDLWNFLDILCMDGEPGVHGIQACQSDVSSHLRKMSDEPAVAKYVALFLARGNRVSVFGFRKLKVKRGGVAVRWTLREIRASLVEGKIVWTESEGA